MHHLIYHGPISERGVRNAMILLSDALTSGQSAVTLHVGSRGGDVNAGVTLYNFIRMLPIETRTHAIGVCESIAATVLLAGKVRSSAPAAVITVHAAKYSEGPLVGQRAPNTDLISEPFKMICGWSDQDVADRFSTVADFRMTPQEAKTLGVIHEVYELGLAPSDTIVTIAVD